MIFLSMTVAEAWNLVAIAALLIAVGYNLLYYFSHSNGKRPVRMWAAVVLSASLVFRVLLALRILDTAGYSLWVRPWVGLVYIIPAMDAFVDWHRNQ